MGNLSQSNLIIAMVSKIKLIILFDGGCPFCQREVSFLRSKDVSNLISFVDINSSSYKPELFSDISYREAMGRIHAIKASGEVIKNVDVFREAYRIVGLGWIYAPTTLPVLAPVFDQVYKLWASWRLTLTCRPSLDQLCKLKDINANQGKSEKVEGTHN